MENETVRKQKFENSTFEGTFHANGTPKEGVFTYLSGDIFEGTIDENEIRIEGVYTHANGDKFTGTFDKNSEPKKGTYTYNSGDTFTGTYFRHGKRKEGIFQSTNGAKFEGIYNGRGKYEKEGKYTYANGAVFTGVFHKDGSKKEGTYLYTDGNKFEGIFDDFGDPIQGKLIYPNGKWFEGTFRTNGDPKEGDFMSANGEQLEYLFEDGDKFQGTFDENDRIKKGTMLYKNGDISEGIFFEDNFFFQGTFTRWNGEKFEGAFLEAEFNEMRVNPDKYLLTGKEIVDITYHDKDEIFYTKLNYAKENNELKSFVNQVSHRNGKSLLLEFICRKKIALAGVLMDFGADEFKCDESGNEIHALYSTRYAYEMIMEKKVLLEKLLAAGVNLDEVDKYNNSAFLAVCRELMGAYNRCKKENIEIIDKCKAVINVCLEYKPDIKRKQWGGNCAIEEVLINSLEYKPEEIEKYYK